MNILALEELSTPALEALDRTRTVVILGASPLEAHGPHLPVGVDVFGAGHLARALAERLVAARPGWRVILGPILPIGSFAFDAVGTVAIRQRVVRDLLVDYGRGLAHAGFRYIFLANGHAGPGHLVALEEAAAIVTRREGILMASVTGHLAWQFLRGRYLPWIETALGRSLTTEEREAFADDAHGGWWETSMMLLIRPDLVDEGYRSLPPMRYTWPERLRPSYATRDGGPGYVGHPALADPAFAKATLDVLTTEALRVAEDLLDGHVRPARRRSPFFAIPFLRTRFWPVAGTCAVAAGVAWWLTRSGRRPRHPRAGPGPSPDPEKGARRP